MRTPNGLYAARDLPKASLRQVGKDIAVDRLAGHKDDSCRAKASSHHTLPRKEKTVFLDVQRIRHGQATGSSQLQIADNGGCYRTAQLAALVIKRSKTSLPGASKSALSSTSKRSKGTTGCPNCPLGPRTRSPEKGLPRFRIDGR